VVAAAELDALAAVGMPEAGAALDVGCGPGFVAARFAAALPALRFAGLDLDRGVLSRARAQLPVVRADAAAPPFAAVFDFVHLRLVLRHHRAPAAVVSACAGLLRARGTLA